MGILGVDGGGGCERVNAFEVVNLGLDRWMSSVLVTFKHLKFLPL